MRYADSLPKIDAADRECIRPVTKTPSAVLHAKRIIGSEGWLMGGGEA